jgi:hypothetical protein
MGLFDDAEKLVGNEAGQGSTDPGQGGEDGLGQGLTKDGEQFLDNETGGKFDSEIQQGGDTLDQQVDKDLPNL